VTFTNNNLIIDVITVHAQFPVCARSTSGVATFYTMDWLNRPQAISSLTTCGYAHSQRAN